MKILLIYLLISTMYASDTKLAVEIFSKISIALTQKTDPNMYVYTNIKDIQEHENKLKFVKDCSKADLVLLSSIEDIPSQCEGKLLFGTRYYHLKDERVVGAFFWQKGRPNIVFYKSRLEKNNIKLDSSFNKYIEK